VTNLETLNDPTTALAKVKEKLSQQEISSWFLSPDLFGYRGSDIYNFEIYNYLHFLDNAASLSELIRGLEELDPLADDSLAVARAMDEKDFDRFKVELEKERELTDIGASSFPEQWGEILIPSRFIMGLYIASECQVPLGAALIRVIQIEANLQPPVYSQLEFNIGL
jgi:hypothetical protein